MKGRALLLFEEGVPGREVELPGLELRETVNGGMREEVLSRDRQEVRGLDQDVLPNFVGIAAEFAEGWRGDSLELSIARCVDVDNLDTVDLGDTHFEYPRRKKLLSKELVEGLVEKVFDARGNCEIDWRDLGVEEVAIRIDTVRAVGAEALVGYAIGFREFDLDEKHDALAGFGLVHDHCIDRGVTCPSVAIGPELGYLA